jgi:ATP-independent RNA helicase DbpA
MDTSFALLALTPALHEAVRALGYERMTPIQAASIPPLLEGRDLIGQSQTGSGKTAAFALPILQQAADLGASGSVRTLSALVLCPTRELSAQVARELRKLGRNHAGLQVLVLAGGEPLRAQRDALERGVHVAVGTPGRVLDHLERGSLELSTARMVVLDEADRMLDMGFADEMEQILAALPAKRQTVFFSATFPGTIEALSRRYQRSPFRVTIEQNESTSAAIEQLLIYAEPEAKLKTLLRVLAQHPHESALIFANLKASVAELHKALAKAGMSVGSIHGDLEQRERDQVLAKFRNASTRVLVATDVAARGIDVESLDLVVNYDLPAQPEVYVHRIGRTGRAGKAGLAVSLANQREKPKIQAIEALVGKALTRERRLPKQAGLVAADLPGEGEARAEEVRAEAPGVLPTHSLAREAKMVTLKVAGGRKQKMRPGDILGALTGEAGGLPGAEIGKIEIHDNFSFVAVAAHLSKQALKSLSTGRIKGKRFVVTLVK